MQSSLNKHSLNTSREEEGRTPPNKQNNKNKKCAGFLLPAVTRFSAAATLWLQPSRHGDQLCRCAFPLLNEEKQTRGLAWSSCWGRNRSQHAAINESLVTVKVVMGWVGGGRGGTQPLPNTEILSQRSMCVYSISSLFPPLRLSSSYKLTRPALGKVTSTVQRKKLKASLKLLLACRGRQLTIWCFHIHTVKYRTSM